MEETAHPGVGERRLTDLDLCQGIRNRASHEVMKSGSRSPFKSRPGLECHKEVACSRLPLRFRSMQLMLSVSYTCG